MENYRTFVGIPFKVGPDFLSGRRLLMQSLSTERISWVRAENYHLTLRFLGETPSVMVEQVMDMLDKHVRLPAPRKIALKGVGSFGPRRNPRVVWVGFSDELYFRELKEQVDQALRGAGIDMPGQTFTPHLTMGRIRRLNDAEAFYSCVRSESNSFREELWVDRLVYFRSILQPDGARYQALKTWPFPG